MFEHAEPAVAIPGPPSGAAVQEALFFPMPRPLGRLLDVLSLVGGAPPGRAPATWREEQRTEIVREHERHPLEHDGARRFLPDEVLVVCPADGVLLATGPGAGGVAVDNQIRSVFVYSVRDLARTWDRYLPRTLRRCELRGGAEEALQLVAISRLGVVDVFDVDRSLAIRRAS